MPTRVVFFGNSTSTFTRRYLTTLLESNGCLVALVDAPPSRRTTTNPAAEDLQDFTSASQNFQVPLYEPSNPNTGQLISLLHELKPDLFIAVGYPLILKTPLLGVPRILAANFHASLLPDYRGKHPVFWTLRAGERWAGLTVHAMDTGIDTGDVLYQVKVRTRRDDSVSALYNRIMDESVKLIKQLLTDAEEGSIPRRAQPNGAGSYFSSITSNDYRLNWNWSADKIRRNITVTPGKCFFDIHNQEVFFHNGETEHLAHPAAPGTLLKVRRKRAVVATAVGALSSSWINVSGKAGETFASFCRRMAFKPGDRLAK